jgi:hypothetical protein
MRATISITTEGGVIYTGETELAASKTSRNAPRAKATISQTTKGTLDFSLPVRPFIKKYASGMSGPKRLALLVARIAEGDLSTDVERTQVRKVWNTMTSLMGGRFNSAYDTRARDSGWISSPKPGLYRLLSTWEDILQ